MTPAQELANQISEFYFLKGPKTPEYMFMNLSYEEWKLWREDQTLPDDYLERFPNKE